MAEKTSMAVEASLTLGRDKNSEAESNCSVVCVTLPVSTVFQATLAILTVEMWKVGRGVQQNTGATCDFVLVKVRNALFFGLPKRGCQTVRHEIGVSQLRMPRCEEGR